MPGCTSNATKVQPKYQNIENIKAVNKTYRMFGIGWKSSYHMRGVDEIHDPFEPGVVRNTSNFFIDAGRQPALPLNLANSNFLIYSRTV